MKSKEDIVEIHVQKTAYGTPIVELEDALSAMDDYAKEVSMNFGKWVDMNAVRNGVDAWTVGSGKETQQYTTEQLFDKFMNEYPLI